MQRLDPCFRFAHSADRYLFVSLNSYKCPTYRAFAWSKRLQFEWTQEGLEKTGELVGPVILLEPHHFQYLIRAAYLKLRMFSVYQHELEGHICFDFVSGIGEES